MYDFDTAVTMNEFSVHVFFEVFSTCIGRGYEKGDPYVNVKYVE